MGMMCACTDLSLECFCAALQMSCHRAQLLESFRTICGCPRGEHARQWRSVCAVVCPMSLCLMHIYAIVTSLVEAFVII